MLPGLITTLGKAAGAPVSGGNDSYTKLLYHFDGNLTDSSLVARGNGTVGGSFTYSTSVKKFGTHSGYWQSAASSVTVSPNSTDFDFSNGDFTIDWWEWRLNKVASQPVYSRDYPTTFVPLMIWSSATNVEFYASTNGTSWNAISAFVIGSMDNNIWNHFAVARSGNTLYGFKNGVLTGTAAFNFTIPAWGNPPVIGAALNGFFFYGYIDEFRISKGIARWTSNFTPPTAAYF